MALALGSILSGLLGGASSGNGLIGDIGQAMAAVGSGLSGTGTGSKLAGATVQGRTHGMLIMRTASGKTIYVKTQKRRRSRGRSGGGGTASMFNMMLKMEMIRAMRGK